MKYLSKRFVFCSKCTYVSELVQRNPGLSWSLPGSGALPTDVMPVDQSNDDALCNESGLDIKLLIWPIQCFSTAISWPKIRSLREYSSHIFYCCFVENDHLVEANQIA